MDNFDYISSPDFRSSLENDYIEMHRCAENGAWKSVQILAGSIVECLLIDYLVSTSSPPRQKDPLKMDLAEAITICKNEKVLSERTADLCSVIRSYRNLIHPGRMIRLNEATPNKTTCSIAIALIDLILTDIAKTRRAAVGLTGEQILSKIMRDPSCMSILSHLMNEVSEDQRLNLLLNLLPNEYFAYQENENEIDNTPDRMTTAYRDIFESSTEHIKKQVAQKYIRILKEDDGDSVSRYRNSFFKASDLDFIEPQSVSMVKEHLLSSLPSLHNKNSLSTTEGIGVHLKEEDCTKWFDPIIRTLASTTAKDFIKRKTKESFLDAICYTSRTVDERLKTRINDWIQHYEKQNSEGNAVLAKELMDEIIALSPP